MGINLLSVAKIQASVQNQRAANRPYSVYWTDNRDLKDWNIFVNMDIVGAWNGFLFGTKRTASDGFIGPVENFPSVDALVNDHIFFRMRYDKHTRNQNTTSFGKIQWITTADPIYDDLKSLTFPIEPDVGFRLYEIDMNVSSKWTGLITNIRFFPCEDGARNDEFFLTFFEIGTLEVDFQLDNPAAGTPGKITGGTALTSDITITKDVNDTLAVNIDGYGFLDIKLTPQTTSPIIVARDLAIQLSKIATGGYMRAFASIDLDSKKLIIESGSRSSGSSVQIQSGPQSAAFVLGLTNQDGLFIGTSETGSDPSPDFISISEYRPTTFELLNFLDNSDDSTAFVLDPDLVVLEGGRRDYGTVTKNIKTNTVFESSNNALEGSLTFVNGTVGDPGKTFIDINHPFTDDGKLTLVAFNGVADEDGGTKWKIFRPNQSGSITLIAEGVIGQRTFTDNPDGGLVLTTAPGAYVADVSSLNVRVQRGDLLGIFNASLHLGTGRLSKPDALYYEVSGDAQGTISAPVPQGAGSGGIPVYARGTAVRRQCVLDIDFQRRVNMDTLTVLGEEASADLEYNVASATSANFSVDTPGTHTICRRVFLEFRECFERPNQGFNIQALNDGIRFADNGITSFGDPGPGGIGGADVDGATYFYINGDGEFLDSFDFDPSLEPSLFDFDRDPFGINCFFSSSSPRLDKPISKAVIYFKDPKNMRGWQIESARGQGDAGGNGSLNGFELIPEESIIAIEFDDKRVGTGGPLVFTQKDTGTQSLLAGNPVVLDVIAKDGTRNPRIGVDFQQNVSELGGANFAEQATYLNTQWTKFQWEFEPIRTTGFRWFCDYHFSSKISEFEVYASASAKESLADNIQLLFSADGENFFSAETINSSTTSAEFQLGNSPRYMRLIFRPSQTLFLKNLLFNFEQDQILFGEEGRILNSTPVDEAPVGILGPAKIIPVKNNIGVTADLLVDIPVDAGPSKELIYFNHLNTEEQISLPEIGGAGIISFNEDKPLLETENVAINAQAYGLKNLTSLESLDTFTPELLINGGFETGDLTGWRLNITQSGTKSFQIPRVYDIETPGNSDFDPSVFSQDGDFLFGFSMDERIVEQASSFAPTVFDLETQALDVTEFADSIDLGSAEAVISFKFAASFTPNSGTPRLIILGSPDADGIEQPPGTVLSPEYGSNIQRSLFLGQSSRPLIDTTSDIIVVSNLAASIKAGTRFIKFIFQINALGVRTLGIDTQKFFLDSVSAKLRLANTSAVQWYKSWRTGAGDFTDASFKAITDLTAIVGSHHWYQPFLPNSTTGSPIAGQVPGFSNAFANDRFLGIQSFSRMTLVDPGILGCQWVGERIVTGFRIGFSQANVAFSLAWPRHWFVQVLRAQSELGEDPDINNPAHFTTVINYTQTGPWDPPGSDLVNSAVTGVSTSPSTIITTWLFNTPVVTEGIRLVFKTNCDKYEKDIYGAGVLSGASLAAFTADTTCPANNQISLSFTSQFGLSVTLFQALESTGVTRLPLDNVKETIQPNTNVFAALDLRRPYSIDINTNIFELIVDAFENTSWISSSVIFSSTDTDDPNAVVWGNTSASFARWLRFQSIATEKYEDPVSLNVSTTTAVQIPAVVRIPQGIIRSARIYPDITIPSLHTIGFNSEWELLGEVITDNSRTTFINYSDFPVIAIDLAEEFILASSETAFRPIHDLLAGGPGSNNDTIYWDPRDNSNFTYSSASFRSVDNPQVVKFLPFGSTAPSTAVRWVAFRGDANLRGPFTSIPRVYNFNSSGGRLFNSFWRPAVQDQITDHPSWFRTKKTGLKDVSTFDTTLGNTFTAVEGIDYGANAANIGSSFYPFDGQFSLFVGDIWGIQVRNNAGEVVPGLDFPHKIHRVFRDPFTFQLQPKTITAFKVLGYNEKLYPKSFSLERLSGLAASNLSNLQDAVSLAADRELLVDESSWTEILSAQFSDVDTFAEGEGFLALLDNPITAAGFRLIITESEYPDDADLTEINDAGGFSTTTDVSGPQTRLVELVFYEDSLVEAVVEGQIDINHCPSSVITASSNLGENPITNINDENIATFWQSSTTSATITIILPGARPISRLEWEKDPNLGRSSGILSTNAPADFVLKAVLPDTSEQVVLTQVGFIGDSFSGDLLGAPVNVAKFILEITAAQGENEGANSLQISELRLIEEFIQETPLVVIDEVQQSPEGNGTSTRITYSANTDAPAEVSVDGMDAGSDVLFSERDFFDFNLEINNIALLDTSFGYIKIGNSPDISYRWDIKDIPNLISGWNRLRLQFKSASDRAALPVRGGPLFNVNTDSSQVDFTTEDAEFTSAVDGNVSQRVLQAPGIRFFEIRFRGTKAIADTPLTLSLNEFKFTRNKFEDLCKFNNSLYLNNSEVLQLNVENIDISLGTVEFWLQPDWNTAGIVPSRGRVIPSLFRVTQTDGKFICFFYRPGTGFTFMVYDGQQLRQFESQFGSYSFNRYDTFHVAVLWDSLARIGREKSSVVMLINGTPVFGSRVTWDAVRQGRGNFMIGGELSQSQTANPFNSTALAFTTVPTLPARHTASAWALMENLKVYNYAKFDFSERNNFDISRSNLITANEMVEVSIDGVNFLGIGSPSLPLIALGIVPGASANIYVRTNIPKNLTGEENRDAALLVTWKAPKNVKCD